MKDVRIILGQAFEALTSIAKDHDLKSEQLNDDDLNALCSDIAKLSELVEESLVRAVGHRVVTLYAIGKETSPGEYAGFTHGPTEVREEMEGVAGIEDGDCLVKIVTSGGIVNYVTEHIFLDGAWNETGDELKAGAA
jgi:hypothetical protein